MSASPCKVGLHQRMRGLQQGTETVLSSPQTTARLLLQTCCCAQVIIPPMQAEQRVSRVDLQRSGHDSAATRWFLAQVVLDASNNEPSNKPSTKVSALLCIAVGPFTATEIISY